MLTCGISAAAGPARTLAQLEHVSWTQRDGVPDNINAMAQTTDGWLWIGTPEGLWRFDGLRFTAVTPARGMRFPDQNVYTLQADGAGGLWIGWMFGGVSHYQAGRVSNWGTADGVPPGAMWSIALDGKDVWAAGIAGLARFDGTRWQRMGPAQGFTARKAAAVFVHADGMVAAFTEQGLFLRRRGALRPADSRPVHAAAARAARQWSRLVPGGARHPRARQPGRVWQRGPVGVPPA